jgi:hypothetical protein
MDVSGQLHDLAALPLKKPPIPTEQEAIWTLKLVWMLWRRQKKYLALAEK